MIKHSTMQISAAVVMLGIAVLVIFLLPTVLTQAAPVEVGATQVCNASFRGRCHHPGLHDHATRATFHQDVAATQHRNMPMDNQL